MNTECKTPVLYALSLGLGTGLAAMALWGLLKTPPRRQRLVRPTRPRQQPSKLKYVQDDEPTKHHYIDWEAFDDRSEELKQPRSFEEPPLEEQNIDWEAREFESELEQLELQIERLEVELEVYLWDPQPSPRDMHEIQKLKRQLKRAHARYMRVDSKLSRRP